MRAGVADAAFEKEALDAAMLQLGADPVEQLPAQAHALEARIDDEVVERREAARGAAGVVDGHQREAGQCAIGSRDGHARGGGGRVQRQGLAHLRHEDGGQVGAPFAGGHGALLLQFRVGDVGGGKLLQEQGGQRLRLGRIAAPAQFERRCRLVVCIRHGAMLRH
ncbi:hypothetical protein FQZ97_828100 [compost metagenome]